MGRKNFVTLVVLFAGIFVSGLILDVLFPGHPHSRGWYLASGWGPLVVSTVLDVGVFVVAVVVRSRSGD